MGHSSLAPPGLGSFDYSALPTKEATELYTAAGRIRERLARSASDIVAIGFEFLVVKERLPHGAFAAWLGAEFGLNIRTAQRFMGVARRFGGNSDIMSQFPATVVYLLAAPSTPDEVIEGVLAGAVDPTPTAIQKAVAELRGEPLRREPHVCPTLRQLLGSLPVEARFRALLDVLESLPGRSGDAGAALGQEALARHSASAPARLRPFAQMLAIALQHCESEAA
jgi:hypothetical protein